MPAAQSPLADLIEGVRAEQERTQQELRSLTRMVDQSRNEVEKLAQRSAAATAQVRQLQANLANAKVSDLKTIYDAALDTQQRLFTMRGQLEKMQGEQTSLGRLTDFQGQLLTHLEELGSQAATQMDATGVIVRVVEAQEAERRRLSRQIHDGPAQALSNFILQTEIATRLFNIDPERARTELQSLKTAATSTLQKVRDFIFDLRPMMLDDLGVVPTLKKYIETFRERASLQVNQAFTGTDGRFEPAREAVVFRGIQELLTNVRNHAQASQVNFTFDMDSQRVRAIIEDNGKGFDAAVIFAKAKATGLITLKEQVEMLGGRLEVESRPGEGTRAHIEVPVSGE